MIPRFLLAGVGWGIVAYLLGAKAFGPMIWGGILVTPVIGVVVGQLTHRWFEQFTGYRRWLVALLSLYVGAVAFGIAIGVGDLFSRGATHRSPFEAIWDPVIGSLWGTSMFIIALWPLAYFTHVALEWSDNQSL